MPYRSEELARTERAKAGDVLPEARRIWIRISPAACIAAFGLCVPIAVFSLALVPPPGSTSARSTPAPDADTSHAAPTTRAQTTPPRAPPDPTAAFFPYGDRFAPGVFGSDGSLALPDGRYTGHLFVESGFADLERGAECVVDLENDASRCSVEIRCGDRLLYAAHDSATLDCDRGSDGGTTMLMDRAMSHGDGSPGLTLQHGSGDGFMFELFDYGRGGFGWDRGHVTLTRDPARPIL